MPSVVNLTYTNYRMLIPEFGSSYPAVVFNRGTRSPTNLIRGSPWFCKTPNSAAIFRYYTHRVNGRNPKPNCYMRGVPHLLVLEKVVRLRGEALIFKGRRKRDCFHRTPGGLRFPKAFARILKEEQKPPMVFPHRPSRNRCLMVGDAHTFYSLQFYFIQHSRRPPERLRLHMCIDLGRQPDIRMPCQFLQRKRIGAVIMN